MVSIDERLCKANNLNSLIDRIWFPTPMYWNSHKCMWEFHESKVLPYLASFLVTKTFFIATCVFGIYIGIQNPGVLTITHLIGLGLFNICLLLLLSGDIVLCKYGKETQLCINWSYRKIAWLSENGSPRAIKNFGLLAIGLTLLLVLSALFTGVVAVYLHVDPLFVYFKYFKIENNVVKIINQISIPYVVLIFVTCYRTAIVTFMPLAFFRYFVLKSLVSFRPTTECVQIYKENAIVMQIMFPVESFGTAAVLTGVFVGLLLSANAVLLANIQEDFTLLAFALLLLSIFFTCLQFVFSVGSSFFEISGEIIALWKFEVGKSSSLTGFQKKHLKRVIRSLRIIRLPVGTVGIVDNDIKVNYLEKLLDYLVDSILFNPLIK